MTGRRDHEYFMRIALEEAHAARGEGNDGVGSVIVRDGQLVARGHNLVSTTRDVTAHAETVALREGGRALGGVDFSSCVLYTTFEPCPMCCGAIVLAGISVLIVGARPEAEQRLWPEYSVERLIDSLGRSHMIEVEFGVLADECAAVRM
jgi:tRNA(adenine34) deaminase